MSTAPTTLAPSMGRAAETGSERPADGASTTIRRLALLSVAMAIVPIVVAAARAVADGWFPVGDNGLLAIRSYDVLTEHHPLLGTWTSASVSVGTAVSNPGPLLFDLLAPLARLFGLGPGVALGSALLNVAAVVGVAVAAWRRGGALLTAGAMAVAGALAWSMGSELLHEPWQPHSLLLPFLCFLFLAWSLNCGDLPMLPWVVALGSLLVQTHLSYSFLVPALAVWGVVGLALHLRRRAQSPEGWAAVRGTVLRVVALSAVVAAVLWAQPLVEQVAGEGRGNLGLLVESATDPPASVGYGRAVRPVATVLALPPWWLRSSFAPERFVPAGDDLQGPSDEDLPSRGVAVTALAAVLALLMLCALDAHRRRDEVAARASVTAAIAVVVGIGTAARLPIRPFGLAPHQIRWLWPLAAFVTYAIVIHLCRRLGQARRRPTWVVGAFTAVAAVVAVLNLPTSDQGAGADPAAVPVVRDIAGQLDELDLAGPVLVDELFPAFGDDYGAGVLAQLRARGVPFVARSPGLVRQLGSGRRFTGENADTELLLRTGDAARQGVPRARRLALHDGLSEREQGELAALVERIARHIRDGGLRLNGRGEAAVDEGRFPVLEGLTAGPERDPQALFSSRELFVLIHEDLLVVDRAWAGAFERYAELQRREDTETVALFVRPLDVDPPRPG